MPVNRLDARLADVIEPVRDVVVGEILEAMARSLDEGFEVRAEPQCRDQRGTVVREGRLSLPRRRDLLVMHADGALTRQIHADTVLRFEPVTIVEPDGFVCVISPFRWDAATVLVEAREGEPDWKALRRWFLEWFQSRFSAEAPDLDGAVHSMAGPEPAAGAWLFVVDLGSAPVDALADMIGALKDTGATRVRIGEAGVDL